LERYDLAVIGTGPAGHFGAIQAAKLGKRVVAIEQQHQVGGVSALSGTIPSKALREAVMHLTGFRQRTFYGAHYRVKDGVTIDDLIHSRDQIIRHKTSVFESQLKRNGVHVLRGTASFAAPNELEVDGPGGTTVLGADQVLLAVGSRPAHPPGLPFDGTKILDSNQILDLGRLPGSLLVVGAGVIGLEYASIFSALGVRTTVVNKGQTFLEFVDRQMVEALSTISRARTSASGSGKRSSTPRSGATTWWSGPRRTRSSPRSASSTAWVARAPPTRFASTGPGSRPIRGDGFRWMDTSRARCPTSTPPAT